MIACILVGGTNLLPPSQPPMRPHGAITKNITFYIFTSAEFLFHDTYTHTHIKKKTSKDCANKMQLHRCTGTFSTPV